MGGITGGAEYKGTGKTEAAVVQETMAAHWLQNNRETGQEAADGKQEDSLCSRKRDAFHSKNKGHRKLQPEVGFTQMYPDYSPPSSGQGREYSLAFIFKLIRLQNYMKLRLEIHDYTVQSLTVMFHQMLMKNISFPLQMEVDTVKSKR